MPTKGKGKKTRKNKQKGGLFGGALPIPPPIHFESTPTEVVEHLNYLEPIIPLMLVDNKVSDALRDRNIHSIIQNIMDEGPIEQHMQELLNYVEEDTNRADPLHVQHSDSNAFIAYVLIITLAWFNNYIEDNDGYTKAKKKFRDSWYQMYQMDGDSRHEDPVHYAENFLRDRVRPSLGRAGTIDDELYSRLWDEPEITVSVAAFIFNIPSPASIDPDADDDSLPPRGGQGKKKKSRKNKTKKNKKRRNKTQKAGKKANSQEVYISARERDNKIKLQCDICNNDKFYTKNSMLRGGRWASFFDTEWLFDRNAKLALCDKCSNIIWFKDKKAVINAEDILT